MTKPTTYLQTNHDPCQSLWFNNVYIRLGNAFNADERTVAAGYDNGDIKLFDLKNMSLRWETNVKNGVSSRLQKLCLEKIMFISQIWPAFGYWEVIVQNSQFHSKILNA